MPFRDAARLQVGGCESLRSLLGRGELFVVSKVLQAFLALTGDDAPVCLIARKGDAARAKLDLGP